MDCDAIPELHQMEQYSAQLLQLAAEYTHRAEELEHDYKQSKNQVQVVQQTAECAVEWLQALSEQVYSLANDCRVAFERTSDELDALSRDVTMACNKVHHHRERVARQSVYRLITKSKPSDPNANKADFLISKRTANRSHEQAIRSCAQALAGSNFRSETFARLLKLAETQRMAPLDTSKLDQVGHGYHKTSPTRRVSSSSTVRSSEDDANSVIALTLRNSRAAENSVRPVSVRSQPAAHTASLDAMRKPPLKLVEVAASAIDHVLTVVEEPSEQPCNQQSYALSSPVGPKTRDFPPPPKVPPPAIPVEPDDPEDYVPVAPPALPPPPSRRAETVPSWVPRPCLGKAVAEFEFTKRQHDELSFAEGDLVFVLNTDDPDWWNGTTSPGVSGFFPSQYVKVLFSADDSASNS